MTRRHVRETTRTIAGTSATAMGLKCNVDERGKRRQQQQRRGECVFLPRSRTNSADSRVRHSRHGTAPKIFLLRARVPHASRLISRELAIVLTNLQHCASLSFFTRDGTVKGPFLPLLSRPSPDECHLARALLRKLNAPGAPHASQECHPVPREMHEPTLGSVPSSCD